jgi:hypothetical protein
LFILDLDGLYYNLNYTPTILRYENKKKVEYQKALSKGVKWLHPEANHSPPMPCAEVMNADRNNFT